MGSERRDPQTDTRKQLIRLLADGGCHSGEALARALGLSRAAVWKNLRGAAADLGLRLQAIPGRGYRLERPLEPLDSLSILQEMAPEARARVPALHLLEQADSTNAALLRIAAAGGASGTLCLAERQSAGRGRRGRPWVSPYGTNIYLSLLWRFPMAPAELSGLSLACGLAVLRALRDLGVLELGLKWPNDILHQGRKLAGLLIELSGEAGGPTQAVIGVGVNTFLPPESGRAIDQPWTDLAQVAGAGAISRNRLAGRLAARLVETLGRYGSEGLRPWLEEWQRHDLFYGRAVALHQGAGQLVRGMHAGIDPSGALLLAVEGRVQAFHAGEISLRPISGAEP